MTPTIFKNRLPKNLKNTRNNSPTSKEESVKRVGGAKNQHDTRICQRIECSKCGNLDYISVGPAKGKALYCKACAAKILNTYEIGRRIDRETTEVPCSQCAELFHINSEFADKPDLLCPSCLNGFESWKGSLQNRDSRQNQTIELRSSGVLLRKRNK